MRLLFEKWNKFLLTEANDMIKTGQNLVIFADWAKGHIENSHKQPGKGSVFADFELNLINDAVDAGFLNKRTMSKDSRAVSLTLSEKSFKSVKMWLDHLQDAIN